MDQNFMVDSAVIRKILDAADVQKDETVLEIGPGRGALTRELAKRARLVIAVELDPELASGLDIPRTRIIRGNALDEIPKLGFDKVVSNIPYSISEPLVEALSAKEFAAAVLTVPKGFAHIVCAPQGSQKYSRLSFISQAFYEPEILFDIPKEAFDPKPKVNSAVLRLVPRKSLLRTVLLQRKKKLRNALMEALCEWEKLTKSQSRKAIKSFELNNLLDKKVREMSLAEMQKMVIKMRGHT